MFNFCYYFIMHFIIYIYQMENSKYRIVRWN